MSKIRVLIVDDHPSVMEGTKAMLEQEGTIAAEMCSNPTDVLGMLGVQTYDVLLFDLQMPELNGLELTRRVLALDPEAVVLIYTGVELQPRFNRLIEAGVSGMVSKTATREQLVTAIRCAVRREAVVPVSLLRELRRDTARTIEHSEEEGTAALDAKDMLLLREIAKGKSNRIMAEELIMSQRSLEYALTRLFQRLKVHSRIEAVSRARQLGILLAEDVV